MNLKLSEPKEMTFIIAAILGVLGILAELVTIPSLSAFSFWLVAVAFILLAVGALVDGL
jgi:heme/copper-type cytochrome/quinol oxidase subunit 1